MKYANMLGLAAVAAAALMAFVGAGTASATELTSPAGTPYHGPIVASHDPGTEPLFTTDGFKNIECNKGTIGGNAEGGGPTETVHGAITTFTFEECNCEMTVIRKGSFELHTIAGTTNGTLTSTGFTKTMNCNTIFGNVHCIYITNNTDLGTLTGSSTTGGTATIDITAKIPQEETNPLCAEESVWHAKYIVTEPDFLDVSP